MKNKNIFTILFLLASLPLVSQTEKVGIQTENPQQLFHIDPARNNDVSGGNLQSAEKDDVVITEQGTLGIGTQNPYAGTKLDVRGKFQYKHPSAQPGYVLSSDNSGNATWREVPKVRSVYVPNTEQILTRRGSITNRQPRYTNLSITLDPGIWEMTLNGTYENAVYRQNLYVVWFICTSSTDPNTKVDEAYSASGDGSPDGPQSYGTYMTLSATFIVNVSVRTTFYVWTQAPTLPSGDDLTYTGECRLWAYPLGI